MKSIEISKLLGENIRNKRKSLGLSQEKLAELCNLHRTYISQLERGMKNVTVKILFALAENLNTCPSNLIEEVQRQFKEKE